MALPSDDTLRNLMSPSIVVIGGSRSLLASCKEVSRSGVPARVFGCELSDANTIVAAKRPFAIVIPQSIVEFDEDEFHALARDVRARIVVVPDDRCQDDALAGYLFGPLKQALESWAS